MHFSPHLLQLATPRERLAPETLHLATAVDVTWNRPVFRAPALPTPHQLGGELPFTVNRPVPFTGRKKST